MATAVQKSEEDPEPSAAEVAAAIRRAARVLSLDITSAKAHLSYTELTNQAAHTICSTLPVIECNTAKFGQLSDFFWEIPEVKEALASVNNLLDFYSECSDDPEFQDTCAEFNIPNNTNIFNPKASSIDKLKIANSNTKLIQALSLKSAYCEAPTVVFALCKELHAIATLILSAAQRVEDQSNYLVSQCLASFTIVKEKLQKLVEANKINTPKAKKVAEIMISKLVSWIVRRERCEPYRSACILDPRTKANLFEPAVESNLLLKLNDELRQLIDFDSDGSPQENVASSVQESAEVEDDDAFLQSFELSDFVDRSGYSKFDVESKHLLSFVKNRELSGQDTNVGVFWQNRNKAEPFLSKLALGKVLFPGKRVVHITHLVQTHYFHRQSEEDIENSLLLGSLSDNMWKM